MLETTLSTEFVPGTNLSGSLASADWRYLLPSQELETVLCIGIPSTPALLVLSKTAEKIFIINRDGGALQQVDKNCRDKDISNIKTVTIEKFSDMPFDEQSIDLVYLTGPRGGARYLREAAVRSEIDRLLKPAGVLYFEIAGWGDRLGSRKSLKVFLQQGFQARSSFWLTPSSGELRTALPVNDDEAASYFFSNVIYGQSFKKRTLSAVGVLMSKTGVISRIAPRHALLLERSGGRESSPNGNLVDLPEYLRTIAAKSGIDVSNYTFGLSARGKYNTNKVIFFLFGKTSRAVEVVIKMTRSPEFNRRLENEYHILTRLSRDGYVDKTSFPEALFFDYHNGLAVIAIKAVHGKPFRTQTRATPDCPLAKDALDWITQLGKASANHTAASAAEVSEVLRRLFNSFQKIYPLMAEEEEFLAGQIDSIAGSKEAFPLVFQHGDPGTWNMMVSDEANRIIVIDWESGEPEGMPLWDLFYFFRTYASWVSRRQGSRDSIKNFSENFLAKSELHSLLVNVTERYRASVALDRKLIRPLFYTCWMHRALKESTRLTEASLQQGHYFQVLRMCIAQQGNPALRALFQED